MSRPSSQHSKSSFTSRGGHPMAAGSFMLTTAREKPITITHTNFQATKPPSRSNSRTDDSSRTSGRARTSSHRAASRGVVGRSGSRGGSRQTGAGGWAACSLCSAILCTLVGVVLIVAAIFILLDGSAEHFKNVTACVLLVTGLVCIVAAGVAWGCLYRLYTKAAAARSQSTYSTTGDPSESPHYDTRHQPSLESPRSSHRQSSQRSSRSTSVEQQPPSYHWDVSASGVLDGSQACLRPIDSP